MSGGRPIYLLDIDVHGRVYRFASEAIDVLDATGTTLRYAPGLADLSVSEDGAAVEVADPPDEPSGWAGLVGRGAVLSGCPMVARVLRAGERLDQAVILARGALTKYAYGGPGEGLVASIAADWWRGASELVPRESERQSVETWPVSASSARAEELDGAAYPVPLGSPGWIDVARSLAIPGYGSPGIIGEINAAGVATWPNSRLIIARGRVAATTVRVYDVTAGLDWQATVLRAYDLLGQEYSYVTWGDAVGIATFYAPFPDPSHEYWIGWPETPAGVLDPTGTRALSGAAEVAAWLLGERGARYPADGPRMRSQAALAGLQVDSYINEPTAPESWIEQHIGQIAQLSRRESQAGTWYAAWDWWAGPESAVARLDVDLGTAVRVGRPMGLDDDLRTAITLDYARSRSGYLLRRESWSQESPEAYAISSEAVRLFGRRPARFATDIIAREGAADVAMCHLLARYALPHEVVTLQTDVERAHDLGPGDVVQVQDSSIWSRERTCILRAVSRDLTQATLEAVAPHPLLRSIRGAP